MEIGGKNTLKTQDLHSESKSGAATVSQSSINGRSPFGWNTRRTPFLQTLGKTQDHLPVRLGAARLDAAQMTS
jgi:hypothetical protein